MNADRASVSGLPAARSRIPLVRVLALLVLVLAAPLAAFLLYGLATVAAPTRIGPHRRFFAACLAMPPGSRPNDVLTRMTGYVLARRTGPDIPVTAVLLAQRPAPTVRSSSVTSFLFYPDASDTADWCGVEFERGLVSRTWISPD